MENNYKTVIKRDGSEVRFDKAKIESAILKSMKYGSGVVDEVVAETIADEIELMVGDVVDIATIEVLVFHRLVEHCKVSTAKAYEGFRKVREYQKTNNQVDNKILGIVSGANKETLEENSNKNATIHSTQRDLIAGEVSKDLAVRTLFPPHIIQAHNEGLIHIHDLDYQIQNMFNCCLVNLKDMLENGTVINDVWIDTPKSFATACTLATQIVQQVANGQYGGQSISLSHLAPYVRVSYEKHYLRNLEQLMGRVELESVDTSELEHIAKDLAFKDTKREIKSGVQTIQYQINTFSTSNGQAPFLTVFMYLDEDPEYKEETAMIIEEVFKQRILGVKNTAGVYVTPAFPKLIYVLDEDNIHEDSEYRYLTDLSIECVSKRMMPDFISAKKMKENYEGNVFPPMGCRSFLSPYKDENGEYKFYGRFNQGVVTINLPDVGLSANGNMNDFWEILDDRLDLVYQALMIKHNLLLGTKSTVSPIHWNYGAISRLDRKDTVDKLLYNNYSTISLGYTGLYECVYALIGESHTTEKGELLAIQIMNKLRAKADEWKKETNIGFAIYGTPSESTTYKFATSLQKRFGNVENITDKNYIINSYHMDIKEQSDPFRKLDFESQFQKISSGGSVSYVEVANMKNNLKALSKVVEFMYDHIQYAEINTKSDYCQKCGFDGEILLDKDYQWYCPNCGNKEKETMNVCRRTCGYLGSNYWNEGRTEDIGNRVVHLDNKDL